MESRDKKQLNKGESSLYVLEVRGMYGQPVLYSDITSASISFKQNDTTIVSYTKASDEVREGDNTNEIEVLLRQSVSSQLTVGRPLSIRYEIVVPNTDFNPDGSQKEIGEIKVEDIVIA